MKGKLFIFGIGGTGARVLKSIVMLASAGMKIEAEAIVPIIVDPDFANADLTRTIELIKSYCAIREKLSLNGESRFFDANVEMSTQLQLSNTNNQLFKEFIGYNTMSLQNRALASILFSQSNLNAGMQLGFKGNPNIGSVALNQFTGCQGFIDFAAAFKPGDRVFIISSIFGGTGASGFPLLLKNLRGLDPAFPNYNAIKLCPIGAISVLPYFDLKQNPESAIDSSTFICKTKAALNYYDKNVSGSNASLNILYYIGDDCSNQYENNEGGPSQKNAAHFIEFAAALSAIDFTSIPDDDISLTCVDNDITPVFAPNPVFKEFGIESNSHNVELGELCSETKKLVCSPLTQFVLFSKYIVEHISKTHAQPWSRDNGFGANFYESDYMSIVKRHVSCFLEWLTEMSKNKRSFSPFNLDVKANGIFSLVNGITPSRINEFWAFMKSGYDLFDSALNKKRKSLNHLPLEQKFFELFNDVTKEIVNKKYRF